MKVFLQFSIFNGKLTKFTFHFSNHAVLKDEVRDSGETTKTHLSITEDINTNNNKAG